MQSPGTFYDAMAAESAAAEAHDAIVSRRISWLRLLLLTAAVGCWAAGARLAPHVRSALLIGIGVAFVVAVMLHRRVRARLDRHRRRVGAARAGAARAALRWEALPPMREIEIAEGWPRVLARDLGVTGERSLLRLLDLSHPALGGARLAGWLLEEPAPIETIVARQQSVAALRERPALLLEGAAETRHGRAPASGHALRAFRSWCADARWPAARALRFASLATGAACIAVFVLLLVRSDDIARAAASGLILVNVAVSVAARRELQRRVAGIDMVIDQLRGARSVMTLVAEAELVPGAMGELQTRARSQGALAAFAALVRLLDWNAVRHSPMAHWVFNGVVAFDVHLAAALSRWHARNAGHAAQWLDDVADAEALLALGAFAFEHPQATMPVLSDESGGPPIIASGLVHPLLDVTTAVSNDLTLRDAGDMVIVSGPNMAGKTTFLRAVGLNLLLAQAGGAVTAAALRTRRTRLRTSVRVEDDLSRGVSLFMAELERLGSIVRDASRAESPHVFFLLDEVLHGTNAADRRAATRAILTALHRANASGMVTTHDPEIAPVEEGARHLHFDGQVVREDGGAPSLRFDYTARPGPAQHANALALLEMMGIGAAG